MITRRLKKFHRGGKEKEEKQNKEKSTHTKCSKKYKWYELLKVPWFIVVYIEHDEMVVAKWIQGTKDKSCSQGAEEGTP